MFIELPSGRKLAYVQPRIGINRLGHESVTYMGVDSTSKKWQLIETYGPKLVENIIQAISRDILAEAMLRLRKYPIVMSVHDEIVFECGSSVTLEYLSREMSRTPTWADGLQLGAEGFTCSFYQKD